MVPYSRAAPRPAELRPVSARAGAGPPPPGGAPDEARNEARGKTRDEARSKARSGARSGAGRRRSKGGRSVEGGGRLKALNEPRPARVRTDADGRPTAVARPDSTRRGFHAVETVRERWRLDDEWWRNPISRLYHDVVLEGGQLVVLYRDLTDGGWYAQG